MLLQGGSSLLHPGPRHHLPLWQDFYCYTGWLAAHIPTTNNRSPSTTASAVLRQVAKSNLQTPNSGFAAVLGREQTGPFKDDIPTGGHNIHTYNERVCTAFALNYYYNVYNIHTLSSLNTLLFEIQHSIARAGNVQTIDFS